MTPHPDDIASDPHAWFRRHVEAYLAGGLTPEERRQFEAHAQICAACEVALAEARGVEGALRDLFGFVAPAATFEDSLLASLRTASRFGRRVIPIGLHRLAVGLAAAILLGGFGLIGNRILQDGKLPEFPLPRFAWLQPEAARVNSASEPRNIDCASKYLATTQKAYKVRNLATDVPTFDDVPDLSLLATSTGEGETARRAGDANSADALGRGESAFSPPPVVAGGTTATDFYMLTPEQLGNRPQRPPTYALNTAGDLGYVAQAGGSSTTSGGTVAFNTTGGASNNEGMYGSDAGALRQKALGSDGLATGTPATPAVNQPARSDTEVLGDTAARVQQPKPDVFWHYNIGTYAPVSPAPTYFKPDSDADGKTKVLADHYGEDGRAADVKSGKPVKIEADQKVLAFGLEPAHKDDSNLTPAVADANSDSPKTTPASQQPKPDSQQTDAAAQQQQQPPPTTQSVLQRKIIRNGTVEFEVDSFDSAFMQIGKIVAEEGGFVSSTDSDKLPNGKVKGTVTVRLPPDRLDVLVLKLRGLGDLKSQRIAAQDITKQYTDLESALRAARMMESRLLDIIKSGKGEVKDLVEAEKQLGIYRERIEQIEGELRYYASLVAMSTLNVTLFERDIRTPTAAFESESVNAGIEAEDVEKARADALKAIDDAKGRVIESDLKKLDAGQLAATIVAEVSPDAAGPLTDRLKQLGRVARMEAERKQTTQGGTGAPSPGLKLERRATRFNISLYNLANIAPRETVNLTIAAADVDVAFNSILNAMRGEVGDAANKAGDIAPLGRVVSSTLNGQKTDQITGAITLEVKSEHAAAIDAVLRGLGETLSRSITENPDQNNVTRAKRGYSISIVSTAQVAPRETQTLQVAAAAVPAEYAKLLSVLQDPKHPARILSSNLNEQDRQNVTGTIDFAIARTAAASVETALASPTADVYARNVTRSNDAQNTLDSKVHYTVTIVDAMRLEPRELHTLEVEVADVDNALRDAISTAETSSGRVIANQQLNKQSNGQSDAQVIVDVPLSVAPAADVKLRGLGTVKLSRNAVNPAVSAGSLARARFNVVLRSPAPLVGPDNTIGAHVRSGLQTSLKGLAWSLTLIIIGLCLVGPFALIVWAGWKLARRAKSSPDIAKT